MHAHLRGRGHEREDGEISVIISKDEEEEVLIYDL